MLPSWYNEYKTTIETSLRNYLEKYFSSEKNLWLDTIKEATLYTVSGWKRLRAILALEFFLLFSKQDLKDIKIDDDILKFCIALEFLHAYSLVHDDLPAMDNDILRRWEPTTWKKFGEANGILVWDLLNSLAFEILGEIDNSLLLKLFWEAVWLKWMLGWQVMDLYYEKNPEKLTLANLEELHRKKTGSLIKISILWWLILANLTLKKENKFKKLDILKFEFYGEKIGLAFQVKDDILDVEWTPEETGKSIGWEEKWFVYFLGLEKSKEYLQKLVNESFEIISDLKSERLEFLTRYISERKK